MRTTSDASWEPVRRRRKRKSGTATASGAQPIFPRATIASGVSRRSLQSAQAGSAEAARFGNGNGPRQTVRRGAFRSVLDHDMAGKAATMTVTAACRIAARAVAGIALPNRGEQLGPGSCRRNCCRSFADYRRYDKSRRGNPTFRNGELVLRENVRRDHAARQQHDQRHDNNRPQSAHHLPENRRPTPKREQVRHRRPIG